VKRFMMRVTYYSRVRLTQTKLVSETRRGLALISPYWLRCCNIR